MPRLSHPQFSRTNNIWAKSINYDVPRDVILYSLLLSLPLALYKEPWPEIIIQWKW
jgi:hypothetical protein